jgi:mono/diheme cytochrome c family protein
MNHKLLISISLLFLMGCSVSKHVTQKEIKKEVNTSEVIKSGKDLYENRCGKCHKLFAPSDYAIKRWPGIVDSMQPKANITDEQKAQILAYLSSEAK